MIYYDDVTDDAMKLRVWILVDVEEQEWLKYAYSLRDDKFFTHDVFVVRVTATGKIVLSMQSFTSGKPFYVSTSIQR